MDILLNDFAKACVDDILIKSESQDKLAKHVFKKIK